MHPAQGVGDHELGPQQADAVHRQGRHLLGVLGEGEVDVDPGGQRTRSASEPAAAGRGGRRDDWPGATAPSVTVPGRRRP